MFDFEEEMAWQQFRAEANKIANDRIENLIKNWLTEINFKEIVGYSHNYDGILTLYSRNPGSLIGKFGKSVKRLKEMLKEEYHKDYRVEFVEIRGGFLNI